MTTSDMIAAIHEAFCQLFETEHTKEESQAFPSKVEDIID
jgi:hypothetical protein